MTDEEIMALYEHGLSLEHIAGRIVAREANMADAPKKKQALGRVRQVVYETLAERRKRHAGQEP